MSFIFGIMININCYQTSIVVIVRANSVKTINKKINSYIVCLKNDMTGKNWG